MKKKIVNILIVIIIIVGIVGAWFTKNRVINNEDETKQNDIEVLDNMIEEYIEIENIEEVDDVEIEDIVNEENRDVGIVEESDEIVITEDESIEEEQIVIDINDSNFDLSTPSFDVETLTSYGLPILLDFGAEWCGPCQRMHPILEELNNELKGKAIIKYVDIDEYPEEAKDFRFNLIPTQYFITKDGEIYKSHTGWISKEGILDILKEMEMEE